MESILHPGCDPRELARSYRDVLGLGTLYLADLDAITRRRGDPRLYRDLAGLGLDLLVDAGARDASDLAPLLCAENIQMVAGLETLAGPVALSSMLGRVGVDRLIVSLDLRDGRPITPWPSPWEGVGASAVAGEVLAAGVRRLILLDLHRVGSGSGTGTDALLSTLHADHPDAEIIVGGGVSDERDVVRARNLGAAAVLVGSALHDGRIDRESIGRLRD